MESKIKCPKSERLLRLRLGLRDSALSLLIERMRLKLLSRVYRILAARLFQAMFLSRIESGFTGILSRRT